MVPPSAGHSAVHTNYFGCCEIAHRGLWVFLFVLFFLSHKLKITTKIAAGVRIIYFCPTFESQQSGIFGGILHMAPFKVFCSIARPSPNQPIIFL